MPIIYLLLALLFLSYYVINEHRLSKKQRFLFKMINSFDFLMVASLSLIFNKNTNWSIVPFFIIALGLGFIGDFFLGLQYVYPQKKFLFFILGFSAFFSGHLVYLIYYLTNQSLSWWVTLIVLGIIGVLQLVITHFKINFGKFQILVYLYLVVIAFVWAPALVMAVQKVTLHRLIFVTGLTLFFASDCLLSLIYFSKPSNPRILRLFNSSLYFLGQLLIALSLYFI